MFYNPRENIPPHFKKNATSNEVISHNERRLLQIIRQNPGIPRSDITQKAQLTQQSIYRLIGTLTKRGLLKTGAPKPGTGRGQPSPTLFLNPDFAFTLGISVNIGTVGLCLFDFAGSPRANTSINISNMPMSEVLDKTLAIAGQQIANCKFDKEKMFGIGFAIAGFLHEGSTYNTPLPLHEWSLIELAPLINRVFDRPTWTGNSANTAAVCESMLGVGKHISNFAYLSFNIGFGGGIIIDNELLRGGNGNAGEFSAMFTEPDMSKRPAMESLILQLKNNGVNIPSIKFLRENFDSEWPGVNEWVNDVSPALNRVVNAIHGVIDPQAIVFGGQMPKILATMLMKNTEFAQLPRHGRRMKTPKLIISDLTMDASAVGAAAMPFKEIFF